MSIDKILHEGCTTTAIKGFKLVTGHRNSMYEAHKRADLYEHFPEMEKPIGYNSNYTREMTYGINVHYAFSSGHVTDLDKTPGFFIYINKEEALANLEARLILIEVEVPEKTRYRIALCEGTIVYLVEKLKVLT